MMERKRIGVVADDITGSNDIGVMLAKNGFRVTVLSLEDNPVPADFDDMDVLVINTGSRLDAAQVAADKSARAAAFLRDNGCEMIYTKTCSVFRGNIGASFDAVQDALGVRTSMVVAGFPRNGRTTVDGVHYLNGVPVSQTNFANDPVTPLRYSRLSELIGQQSARPCREFTHAWLDKDEQTRRAHLAELKQDAAYPKLIPSNGSAFFEHVMAWAEHFPVYRGDEGGWWEDGVASSFKESAALRDAQASLKCAESLESIAALTCGGSFPRAQYDQAWKQIVLFDEHTWGSFMSQQDPHSMLQEDSWAFKKHLSDDAWNRTSSLVTRSASRISLLWNNAGREVVIYNPYNFPVTGYAEAEIARGETICDQAGNEIVWRVNGTSTSQKRVLVPVKDLPGYSCLRYTLRPMREGDHAGVIESKPAMPRTVLENPFYRVVVDTESGMVCSVFDKELNREICKRPIGELLYAMGGDGSMLRGNHAGLRRDGATVVHGFMPKTAALETSLVDTRVVMEGQAFRGSAKVIITLPVDRKELLFRYEYDKEATPSPDV